MNGNGRGGPGRRTGFARFGTLLVGLALLTACRSSGDGYTRLSPARPVTGATVLIDGDRWVVETVETVPSGDDECVRLRVVDVDRALGCLRNSLHPQERTVFRVGGGDAPRFVVALAGVEGAIVRRWTDRNIGGDAPTAPLPGGGTVAVIELGDDERPWGLQILSADGDLVGAVSLLD